MKTLTALALAGILLLPGCCSCRERYAPFLEHVEDSLRESVKPTMEEALRRSGRKPDLMANDLGEVDDLADGLERVRTHGPNAWQPGKQGGE